MHLKIVSPIDSKLHQLSSTVCFVIWYLCAFSYAFSYLTVTHDVYIRHQVETSSFLMAESHTKNCKNRILLRPAHREAFLLSNVGSSMSHYSCHNNCHPMSQCLCATKYPVLITSMELDC
jgi:hypothetical protein